MDVLLGRRILSSNGAWLPILICWSMNEALTQDLLLSNDWQNTKYILIYSFNLLNNVTEGNINMYWIVLHVQTVIVCSTYSCFATFIVEGVGRQVHSGRKEHWAFDSFYYFFIKWKAPFWCAAVAAVTGERCVHNRWALKPDSHGENCQKTQTSGWSGILHPEGKRFDSPIAP